jgi:glucokinase
MLGNVMILAGDIGGTNTRLGLYGSDDRAAVERSFANRDFPTFDAALARFLDDAQRPAVSSAALAVAGPIFDGRVAMTNIGWTLDERSLSQALGGARVRLLNDLQAAAYGIVQLPDDEFRTLAAGTPVRRGNVAIIGAGTGLGEALLTWDGDTPVAMATEGGHADFAPSNETEFALLEWLRRSRAHVSWEHVVSGPALLWIYEFFRDTGRVEEPPPLRASLDATKEPAVVITQSALAEKFPICVRTLELFVRCYGSEAANLALKSNAFGGVYLTGGIAPDVLTGRWADAFMRAFTAKGRYEDFMRRIPVRLVLCEKAPLLGARAVATAAR